MHRISTWLSLFLLIVALAAGSATAAIAQDATATPDLVFADTLGLPELTVTVTEAGYEGLPTETPAGRYLLSLESEVEEGGAGFMQLPEGMSIDDILGMFAGPPPVEAGASPAAEMTEQEMPEGPPEWYFTTTHAGGVYAAVPGQTVQAIIDLTPGEWIAWPGDPEVPLMPVGLTVTGEMPADLPAPDASATVTMSEYAFAIDGALTSGPQVIEVTNVGAQPHHLIAFRANEGVTLTKDIVAQVLEIEMTGATPAPEAGLPNPEEDFTDAFYMDSLSMGATAWLAVDLEPGDYGIICFIPDVASGMPHAVEGMYDVVTVG